jgi:hypothetical protein
MLNKTMNLIRIVSLLAVFIAVVPVQASSTWTEITRANLNKQPVSIAISVTRVKNINRFRVVVGRKPGVPYKFVGSPRGLLEDARVSSGTHGVHGISVETVQKGGDTIFLFPVADRNLTRFRFRFGFAGYADGKLAQPAADFYWFRLPAFLSPRAIAPKVGKAAAPRPILTRR